MTKAVVIITAYNPGMDLARLAGELALTGRRVIIADIGSAALAQPVFDAVRETDGCQVLQDGHDGRRSFSDGLTRIREDHPYAAGAVTVDYAGNYCANDILSIARALETGADGILLGCPVRTAGKRAETAAGRIVRLSFGLLAGLRVTDPFAGLRGFSPAALAWLSKTRREHEARAPGVLLAASREGIPISEIALESGGCIKPARVSFPAFVRVYFMLVLFASSSLVSYLVDIGLYVLFIGTLFAQASDPILYSTVAARVLSSLLNFAINKWVVFRDMRGDASVLLRYIVLTVLRMLASYAGVYVLTSALMTDSRIVKIGVDLVLFFVGFRVQQSWVFSQSPKR